MRRIIIYYAVSMLMTVYFERAVRRYEFQASRQAAPQIEYRDIRRVARFGPDGRFRRYGYPADRIRKDHGQLAP